MIRITTYIVLWSFFSCASFNGFSKNRRVGNIPFELNGGFIIMKASINGSPPLHFILDSGLRNTIITELFPEDSVSLNFMNTSYLKGLGTGKELLVYTSNSNSIGFSKEINFNQKVILAIEKDIFNLSKIIGEKINGILSLTIFSDYVIDINYSRKRIYLYERIGYVPPKKYKKIPIVIDKGKFYMQLSVDDSVSGKEQEVKMLFDTGAEVTAWFQTIHEASVQIPPKRVYAYVGEGLNGEISGYIARLNAISIGEYIIRKPIVAFPDSIAIADVFGETYRDGTIGGQLLKRFNIIVNYVDTAMYIKKNHYFRKLFTYNISGIEIIKSTQFFNTYKISKVWKQSAAEKLGLKTNDELLEVNFKAVFRYTLPELKHIFETPSYSGMSLKVMRNDSVFTVKVPMKKML